MPIKKIKLNPKTVKKIIGKKKRMMSFRNPVLRALTGDLSCYADCCGCCGTECCMCQNAISQAIELGLLSAEISLSVDCPPGDVQCEETHSSTFGGCAGDPNSYLLPGTECEGSTIDYCASAGAVFCTPESPIFEVFIAIYCICEGPCAGWHYQIWFDGSQLGCGDDPNIPVLCTQLGSIEPSCDPTLSIPSIPFEFDAFRDPTLGGAHCTVTGTIGFTLPAT